MNKARILHNTRTLALLLLLLLGSMGSEAWAYKVTYHILTLPMNHEREPKSTMNSVDVDDYRVEAVRTTVDNGTTVELPPHFKSPLAKNFTYYAASSVDIFAAQKIYANNDTKYIRYKIKGGATSLTEGSAVTADCDIYVTYEYNAANTIAKLDGTVAYNITLQEGFLAYNKGRNNRVSVIPKQFVSAEDLVSEDFVYVDVSGVTKDNITSYWSSGDNKNPREGFESYFHFLFRYLGEDPYNITICTDFEWENAGDKWYKEKNTSGNQDKDYVMKYYKGSQVFGTTSNVFFSSEVNQKYTNTTVVAPESKPGYYRAYVPVWNSFALLNTVDGSGHYVFMCSRNVKNDGSLDIPAKSNNKYQYYYLQTNHNNLLYTANTPESVDDKNYMDDQMYQVRTVNFHVPTPFYAVDPAAAHIVTASIKLSEYTINTEDIEIDDIPASLRRKYCTFNGKFYKDAARTQEITQYSELTYSELTESYDIYVGYDVSASAPTAITPAASYTADTWKAATWYELTDAGSVQEYGKKLKFNGTNFLNNGPAGEYLKTSEFAFIGDPYELRVISRSETSGTNPAYVGATVDASGTAFTVSTEEPLSNDIWEVPYDGTSGSFLLRKYKGEGHWDWISGNESVAITYNGTAQSYDVLNSNAQTIAFNISGLTVAAGNYITVTVGGTNAAQVTATTPVSSSGHESVSSEGTATVTATIAARGTGNKTFTLTIKEYDSGGSEVGTATVITVNQKDFTYDGTEQTYNVPNSNAQTITFNVSGLNGADGNYFTVTVGGTNSAQVTATTPVASTGKGPVSADGKATFTATIAARGDSNKEFTLTIQEYNSEDSPVGTATAITVHQNSATAYAGNAVQYSTSASTRIKVMELPKFTYTYKIVDLSGRVAVQATASQTIFSPLSIASIPSIIVSPFIMDEDLTFYDSYTDRNSDSKTDRTDFSGQTDIDETPNAAHDIFVTYTTNKLDNKPIKLSEDQEFYVRLNGQYIYYDADDNNIKSSVESGGNDNYKWKLRNRDPYAMLIDNMEARTDKGVNDQSEPVDVYNNVGDGTLVTPTPTRQKGAWVTLAASLGNDVALTFTTTRNAAQQFIAKSSTLGGVYEVMVATGGAVTGDAAVYPDASTTYYNIGRPADNTVEIYDQAHYVHGNSVVAFRLEQTDVYTYHLIDKANHELLTAESKSPDLILPAEYLSPLVGTYYYYAKDQIDIDKSETPYQYTPKANATRLSDVSELYAQFTTHDSSPSEYSSSGSTLTATDDLNMQSQAKRFENARDYYFIVGGSTYKRVHVTRGFRGMDIYVTYDKNSLVTFNDVGSPYMLKFLDPFAEGYYLEDGSDRLTKKKLHAVYPYCNGDGNLNIYGVESNREQMEGGSSTRPRWIWYFSSEDNDPYHVMIYSLKTISHNSVDHPTYLQTHAVHFNQDEDPDQERIVTGGFLPGIASVTPTEYMILGVEGQYKLLTTNPVAADLDGSGTIEAGENVRRYVTSLEQYWKTYNMLKLHVLDIDVKNDATYKNGFSNDQSTWVMPTALWSELKTKLSAFQYTAEDAIIDLPAKINALTATGVYYFRVGTAGSYTYKKVEVTSVAPSVVSTVTDEPDASNWEGPNYVDGSIWHSYEIVAYATRWNGYNDKADGQGKKVVEKLEHWFQTFDMGDGTFDIISADIPPVLVLLDRHGWEIMRKPLPKKNYPNGEELEALRAYDSPLVKEYHFYSDATKADLCHKYILRKQNGKLRDEIKVDGIPYTSTSLGDLPPITATGVKDGNGFFQDQYVTYTVKEEYENSFHYHLELHEEDSTYTEWGTPSKFLVVLNGRYAREQVNIKNTHYFSKPIFEATTPTGGNVYDMILNPTQTKVGDIAVDEDENGIIDDVNLWYVQPNLDIDDEMGIPWAEVPKGSKEPYTKYETKKEYKDKTGFDPYNLQLKNVGNSKFFTIDLTSTTLSNGVWEGSLGTEYMTLKDSTTSGFVAPEGYDHTRLQVTKQTFMAVSDANGNMQLMPRFDHTRRVYLDGDAPYQTSLHEPLNHPQKALVTDAVWTMGAETTFLVPPQKFEYRIIDNKGREALRYMTAGEYYPSIPAHFKSPLATDFKYYYDHAAYSTSASTYAAYTAAASSTAFQLSADDEAKMKTAAKALTVVDDYYFRIPSFKYVKVTVTTPYVADPEKDAVYTVEPSDAEHYTGSLTATDAADMNAQAKLLEAPGDHYYKINTYDYKKVTVTKAHSGSTDAEYTVTNSTETDWTNAVAYRRTKDKVAAMETEVPTLSKGTYYYQLGPAYYYYKKVVVSGETKTTTISDATEWGTHADGTQCTAADASTFTSAVAGLGNGTYYYKIGPSYTYQKVVVTVGNGGFCDQVAAKADISPREITGSFKGVGLNAETNQVYVRYSYDEVADKDQYKMLQGHWFTIKLAEKDVQASGAIVPADGTGVSLYAGVESRSLMAEDIDDVNTQAAQLTEKGDYYFKQTNAENYWYVKVTTAYDGTTDADFTSPASGSYATVWANSKPLVVDSEAEKRKWQWKFLAAPVDPSSPYSVPADPYAVQIFNRQANFSDGLAEPNPMGVGIKVDDKDRFVVLSHPSGGYALAVAGLGTYTYSFLNGAAMTVPSTTAASNVAESTVETDGTHFTIKSNALSTGAQLLLMDDVTHTYTYYVINNAKKLAIKGTQTHEEASLHDYEPYLPDNLQSPLLNMEDYLYYGSATITDASPATPSDPYDDTYTVVDATHLVSLQGLYDDKVYVRYKAYDMDKTEYLVPNAKTVVAGKVARDSESNDVALNISGELPYNIIWEDYNMMQSTDNTNLSADSNTEQDLSGEAKYVWLFKGADPYALQIQHKNSEKYVVGASALADTPTKTFMLLREEGYDYGILQETGGTQKLTGYGGAMTPDAATNPTKFIIFGLSLHKLIYHLVINKTNVNTTIPYRAEPSGTLTTKNILGTSQRDLISSAFGIPGDRYQLGSTILGQTYSVDAGHVSIADELAVPGEFYRPNCNFFFYVDNIQTHGAEATYQKTVASEEDMNTDVAELGAVGYYYYKIKSPQYIYRKVHVTEAAGGGMAVYEVFGSTVAAYDAASTSTAFKHDIASVADMKISAASLTILGDHYYNVNSGASYYRVTVHSLPIDDASDTTIVACMAADYTNAVATQKAGVMANETAMMTDANALGVVGDYYYKVGPLDLYKRVHVTAVSPVVSTVVDCTYDDWYHVWQDNATLNNKYKGLEIKKLMSDEALIGSLVQVNIAYSFQTGLETNAGEGFVTSFNQNLWYTFETQDGVTPRLAQYTNAWGLQAKDGRATRYTNDYLWTPLGDVYGFKMYNRYMIKNSGGVSNVMTMPTMSAGTKLKLALPDGSTIPYDYEVFELLGSNTDGYFRVHPVVNNTGTQYYILRDPADNYAKLSTSYSEWTFGLSLELLEPYIERVGYVGGLTKEAYQANKSVLDKVMDGTADYEDLRTVQGIVYDDANIQKYTPGYYRLHSQPGVSKISPVRYVSGYLHDIEKTAVSGGIPLHFYSKLETSTTFGNSGLKNGYTETHATRGDIPVPPTEYDPSTIFYFSGNTTLDGNPRSTMSTQGLYVAANPMGDGENGTGTSKLQRAVMVAPNSNGTLPGNVITFSLMDIGGAVLLIHDGEAPATRRYLNFDQTNAADIYDMKYYHESPTDDAKFCMVPADTLGLMINTNKGGDGYYYTTLRLPYDVLLPEDKEDKTYTAYVCKGWSTTIIHPRKVGALNTDTYAGNNRFIPAGTPVIIRTTDDSESMKLSFPSSGPSTSLSCVFSGKYLEQLLAVDADHDVYTFGLPFISEVEKDADYSTTGNITSEVPEQAKSGVGFYINANPNKENSGLQSLWFRNNRYVLHNKIYYRESDNQSALARRRGTSIPQFIPVVFDDDEIEEPQLSDEEQPVYGGSDRVYDMQGRCVMMGQPVIDGSWRYRLPPGIYILNGKKIKL